MNLQLRKAVESDEQAISEVVTAAFDQGQGQEIADLVTDLLADPTAQPLLSLVAATDGQVVGHILFTAVRIQDAPRTVPAVILAPLAVHPSHQNQGIGGWLIEEGLRQLKASGVELVFVLGHPGYYPRYGFASAGTQGLEAPYPIPPENSDAWMVQALRPGILGRTTGKVRCADALNDPKHWRE